MNALEAMQAYDAKLLEDARSLCKLHDSAEIRAWFDNANRPLDNIDNAYAAAFGALQAVASQLIRWVERTDV